MATKQYIERELICGRTAKKYLNCSKTEFEHLVEQGLIQAYRDESNRWRVSKESVLNYAKRTVPSTEIHLIVENFYEEVIERICAQGDCPHVHSISMNVESCISVDATGTGD